jgi:ATP-binding cassette subfamily B protein
MTTSHPKFGLTSIIKGFKVIFKHTSEYKSKLVFVFALILISSVVDAASPYIWGKVIDSINAKTSTTLFGFHFLEAFGILFIYFVFLVIQSFADLRKGLESRWVEENVRISYNIKGFAHVFKLPLSFHKSMKMGETTDKIGRASRGISDNFSRGILESLPQLLTALIMFFFVVFTNLYMGIVVGIALVGYIYFSAIEIAPTVALQREIAKLYAKGNGMIQDALSNIRSIKDSNTEEYEFQRIKKTHQDEAIATWYKLVKIQRHTGAMQNRIRIVVRAAVLVISVYLISKNEMTIGEMLAYNTYALMIFNPLSVIINNWKTIQNGIISLEEAETIMELPTENYEPLSAKGFNSDSAKEEITGEILFENVSYYYDKEVPVLKSVSFHAKPGETIALVGESGVGKSTLIDLLSGYHFAQEGKVSLGATDIKDMSLNVLRKNTAVVSQEVSLFNESIKYNLAYGSFDKTDEEIREAARKAHCSDFIENFPEKWDQLVGEKGLKLSVGQKQRVAIARAMLKNPKILILDEPTSALDAGTERIISESLNELMKGRTTFIVAHRLSTVREADKILVFKKGSIVEQGTHQELLAIENGEYRRLYELQIGLHN